MITLQHLLAVSGVLFALSVAGIFINRKNVILLLMCIELLLLAANFNFVAFSRYLGNVALGHYLSLGAILFALSVIGIFLNRKNLIVLLMAIELMLLSVNLNFVAFSYYLGDMAGQVFVFFILTVAAAESAIGLAILVVLFRNIGGIAVDDLGELRG